MIKYPLISVQPDQDQNENQIWAIHYGKELQGLIIADQEIESHYYDIHTALLNTFLNDNHAILILEGYMVAIIKQTDFFYLFDSHARDMSGMPDPNGTAVMMRFTNILELEQYLYCLSSELHTNSYEIVPIQVNKFISASDIQEKNRLQKANESKKIKRSEETESERQIRLQKDRLSKKQKRLDETDIERQVRLEKKKLNKRQKQSNETDSARQIRLQRDRLYKKQKRSEQTKKESTPDRVSQHKISQQEYLNTFDITQNGGIEEQSWAKANINKFYKSVQYTVSQCTVCKEAWPLKSKPRVPYVCSRCVRDNKSPRKFSYENSMIPSSVPNELQNLTQIEEMLIARALPIMRIYIKPGGQRGFSGHCINLPQNVTELATSLPRYSKDLAVIIVKVKGKENTFRDVKVRKQKVHNALVWLINNNPHYSELRINGEALNLLPENGVPPDLMTVESDDDIVSHDDCSADTGPPTDNPSEDIVYNNSTEMSSFLPVGQQQQ
jgi:hypothetical protein